jgi:DNA polymerase-3 subunit gamma/tau
MIGQDFVVATLQKSITAGKIAHAYLFSGPRGCGKTSSARILAKALNCEKGPGGTPCGVCSACTEITKGSSLDVIEIDGASNTSVNDVRQIKDEVQFPPNSCRYKIYIIDEVHMLSTSAFNALLKTIEEPPPYVIFVFATTELHKVPATIKSRCQQFNFRLVPVDLLKDVLSAAAEESGIKADEEALFWVAREATGSVRDAYTLFDQVAAFSDGHITFEKIRDKLGLVGVDRINPLIEACSERNGQEALSLLDDIIQNGVSVEQFTVDVADYFRSLLLIRSGITKESLLGQHSSRFSAKVLGVWTPIQIERALGIMLQLFRDIRYSLDPRYELELAVSRLSWITDYVSSAEMKNAIFQAKALLQKGAGPAGAGSGPFNDADRAMPPAGATVREPVRETVILPEEPDEDVPIAPDARIEDPFAALKEKMNLKPAGSPVSSAAVSRPDVLPAASAMAPVTAPSPSVHAAASDSVETVRADEAASVEAPPASGSASVPTIPFDRLQECLVERFESTNSMVSTTLSQAFDWVDSGEKVSFSVDKPFTHNFLEQDHKKIAEAVSALLGRHVALEIKLDASRSSDGKEKTAEPAIPPHVEMLRQMFRGTIS